MTLAESASRVPAIVWRRLTDGLAPPAAGESIELQGAVLLADVTGFTALATRLALQGDAGAELLSGVLDDYFGRLISLVAAYGGEPVKMEGDALLVLWPAPDGDCSLATRRAAACAMAIQDRPHRHDAGHWANLSLRVSVAQGRVTGAHLFSGERWHVVLGGAAIDAVIAAQAGARAGDAVASPCAWALLGAHARGVALDAGAWRLGAVEAAPLPTPPALSWPPSALRGVDAYIAAPMRRRFAAGHGAWLAELRQVSVMFMRWENLDIRAAGWPARLQGAVDIVVAVIARCEGFLKEIAVDDKGCYAVILFGVPPFSHEDDAVRNVRAALALQHALQATGLDASIGLASGCCFCGLIGSEVRRDYAVIGDAMNVAARLMAAARELPGAPRILSDRPTWRRAEGRVAFERLGAVTVKGKTEPVEVARPGAGASDPRPGMAATATVGRVAELATLRTTLAQVANAQARTTTLTIAGEAGMGKSRLAAELTTMAREMGVTVWSGHGDAVGTGTVLFPWRHVFAALLGIAAVDAPYRRRAIMSTWPRAGAARPAVRRAVLARRRSSTRRRRPA